MTSILKVDTIQTTAGSSLVTTDSDTTTIKNPNGTTGLTVDTAGRVFMPERPFMLATHNAATTYSTNAVVTNWAVEDSKEITESSGVFTVSTAGLYYIDLNLMSTVLGSGLYLQKNGSTQWRFLYFDGGGNYEQASASAVLNLSASDAIRFTVQSSTYIYGATTTGRVGSFSMVFLG